LATDENSIPAADQKYDAFLLVSFGGPEGMADVMPFLENVLRGKNVPRERMLSVAHHYEEFGGVSPINGHNRELLAALRPVIEESGPRLPIYWGNRNWHPMLEDTLRKMSADGIKNAIAFVTSAYSSYSSCRQYREDIERARQVVGPNAPKVDKIRVYFNHPGFVEANIERLKAALDEFSDAERAFTEIAFTAHSIPLSMASGCDYEKQLVETARLVAEGAHHPENWKVVYQSRSGPPTQPWLEPDICDHIKALHGRGVKGLVIAPIGFVSDHMEVIYDLDTEAKKLCDELGMKLVRAASVGCHPKFVDMVRDLVEERIAPSKLSVCRAALGELPARDDLCPTDCCPMGATTGRPPAAVSGQS
jgi:ferrochelatase